MGPIISTNSSNYCKAIVAGFFFAIQLLDARLTTGSSGASLLMGFAFVGSIALFSSKDWLILFLSLEILSLSSYCLVGLPGTARSMEAVLKYFTAGALATCFILMGVVILLLSTQALVFGSFPKDHMAPFFVVFCVCGLLIKVGAAPFHYWVADAYEGAPLVATIFLSIAIKIVFFLLLCYLLFGPLWEGSDIWRPLLELCSAMSIIIGCLGALFQKRIKRLLAYSSINNVGFALASLSTGNVSGVEAAITYMLFYSLSLLCLFILIIYCSGSREATYVSELTRLRAIPFGAVLGALTLFSLAGIPPLSGFWTKFFVLQELVSSGCYALAVIGVIGSLVGSFYYLSLIRAVYLESFKAAGSRPARVSTPVLVLLLAPIIAYPIAPSIVFHAVGLVASSIVGA